MAAPQNRIPVRPARGTRTLFDADISNIQEGEILFARDEDALYVKDGGVLVNVANGTGVADQIVSAKLTWEVRVQGNDWALTGPGLTNNTLTPTIYLMRGQRYKFINKDEDYSFQITTSNGAPYNIGITGNPALPGEDAFIEWNVSQQAPGDLRYSATNSSDGIAEGKFIVLSDTFNLDAGSLDDVDTEGVEDGNVLVWSESQQQWSPADLTTGGTTNLAGLTDVNITGVTQDDVLKYNGQFWTAQPEATDPGRPGRKSTVSISDTRSGQMAGTEFILDDESDWEQLGFTMFSGIEGVGIGIDQMNSTMNRPSFLESWSPLGRSDSRNASSYMYFDASGRVYGFANSPEDHASVSSTKKLSVPENVSLAMVAFLKSANQTIHNAGYIDSHPYQGTTWYVLRIEYAQSASKMAVEFWMNAQGSLKIMYGRPDPGFTYDVGPNKNGLVFASRTDDETLGPANTNLPYQTNDGDYAVEFWYNGSGYNLDDLSNVSDSSQYPPKQDFPLVWDSGNWRPGSIVRDGSQASTSGGEIGLFSVDNVYLYVCVGENQWKRILLEAFS